MAAEAEFLDGELNVKTGFFLYPGAMNALARHVMPWLLYNGERRLDCHGKLWGHAKRCRQCHERARLIEQKRRRCRRISSGPLDRSEKD